MYNVLRKEGEAREAVGIIGAGLRKHTLHSTFGITLE